MALTDILQKIIEDAEASVQESLKDAKAKTKEISKKHDVLTAEITAEMQAETLRKKASMEQKIDAHLNMESKSEEALLKTKILKEVQKKALQELVALSPEEHQKILTHLLMSVSEAGTVHPAKGQRSTLERAMQSSGVSYSLGEEADISGGFLFVGDTVDVDGSYETLLMKEVLPKIETELSKILFH